MALAFEGADEEDLINKFNPPMIKNHYEQRMLRSALKGGRCSSGNGGPGNQKSKFLAKTTHTQNQTTKVPSQQNQAAN